MKVSLIILLVFFCTFSFAQSDDNPNNLRAKIFELRVKTIPSQDLKLPFHSIKVIDARFDTSKLGFRITGRVMVSVNNVFEKIMLSQGIEKGIENFYNQYYKNNFTPNGNMLLIAVKKLWIDNLPDIQNEYKRKNIDRLSRQNIHAKFEYYVGSENAFVPIKRTDTIFQLTPDTKVEGYDPNEENKLPFLCFALEKMIENIDYGAYINAPEKKKQMSMEDIARYNADMKNVAILNEPVKKGVFLTLDEFKKNMPSVISFRKRKLVKKKIYEIVDERDNVILHYFAYYDGEKLSIAKPLSGLFATKIPQDNYGVYRVGDSFQFFENHILDDRRELGVSDNRPLVERTVPVTASNIVRVPRQIDLDSEEVY